MKLLFAGLFLLVFTKAHSQNTTDEEYRYLVLGYKATLEQGLDLKKGYSLPDTISFVTQGRKYQFTFMNLIRNSDKSIAGTIIIATSGISNKRYFLGLPSFDPRSGVDLENTLMKQMNDYSWDLGIRNAFLQALAEYLVLKIPSPNKFSTKLFMNN